ncbi:hypothetical protein ACLX1H_000987 [Fusarium chlamydosporum]
MTSRWLTLFLLLTTSCAEENSTQYDYEWSDDNPYWSEEIKPCADEWMPMCFEHVENTLFVPILCICGQSRVHTGFLDNFAQCLGEQAPDKVEDGFMGLQWACSGERLSVNMTKNEFERIAEEGPADSTTSSTLSTGAVAGIAVGAIVGGAAVVGILVWLWLRQRKKNGDKLESNPPSSPKHEKSSTWGTEFKPEWTANAPVELPPNNHAVVELPPTSVHIYEMEAVPATPVEMLGSVPEHVEKPAEEKKIKDEKN